MFSVSEVMNNINNRIYPDVIDSIRKDGDLFFKLVEKAIIDRKNMDEKSSVSFGLTHKLVNFEELFLEDMENKEGFLIDLDVDYTDLHNESMFLNTKSIYSYKYGISNKDPQEVQIKRYSCECGELESPIAGLRCEKCGTYTDIRLCKRGWFDLGVYKIFNPHYLYQLLSASAGAANDMLEDMYTFSHVRKIKKEKDKDKGEVVNIFDLQDRDTLIDWIKRYVQEDKQEYFLNNIDAAMTTKFPVFSKDFRPFRVTYNLHQEPRIESHEVNQKYRLMNDKIREIRKREDSIDELIQNGYVTKKRRGYEIFQLLKSIQKLSYDIHEMTLDGMKDKNDEIRQKYGSTRVPYSSRMVLESCLNIYSDEIIMPYNIFGEKISGYYRDYLDKHGVTPEAINRMMSNAPNKADKELLDKVLDDMIEDNVNFCFGYRPPSIYRRSAVGLKIVGLTEHEVCKLTEITIAVALEGDKDGDAFTSFMFPREYNVITYFAHHPSGIAWNPMTGVANKKYELPESLYLIDYYLLGKYKKDEECLIEIDNPKKLVSKYKLEEPKLIHEQTTFPRNKEDLTISLRNGLIYL